MRAFLLGAALAMALGASEAKAAHYAAVVVDADSGRVLFSRNANHRRIPASLAKMMTLYLTFEALEQGRLTLDQPLKVSRRAAGQAPSKLNLKRGATITVKNAILGLVTKSANDVATVLAEGLAGNEVKFALAMTKKARALGMKHTRFRNASGLPDRRQRSTAHDLSVLARALIRDFPQHYPVFSTARFRYGKRNYDNHNRLLKGYPGTDGIKTGYTRASGFNIAVSVERNGHRLVGIVLGGRTGHSRDAHMKGILDRAFARLEAEAKGAGGTRTAVARAPKMRPVPDLEPVVDSARAETTAQPRARGWSVQVGAFERFATAQAQVHRAAKAEPRLLMHKEISIMTTEGDSDNLFRARLTGLSEQEAQTACARLKQKQFACLLVPPAAAVAP